LVLAAVSVVSFSDMASAQQFNRQQFRAERQQGNNSNQFAGPKVQQNNLDTSKFQRISAPKTQQNNLDTSKFQRISAPKTQQQSPVFEGPKVQQQQFVAPKAQNNGPKVQFAAPPKVQQPRDNGVAQFQAPKAPRNQQFEAPRVQRDLANAEFQAPRVQKKVASLEPEAPAAQKLVGQQQAFAVEKPVEQPAAEATETQEAPAIAQTEEAGKDFVVEYKGGYYKVRKFSDGKVTLLGVAEGYGEKKVTRYQAPSYSYGYSRSYSYGYADNCQNGY